MVRPGALLPSLLAVGAVFTALAGCAATLEPNGRAAPQVQVSSAPDASPSALPSPSPVLPPVSPPVGNPAPD